MEVSRSRYGVRLHALSTIKPIAAPTTAPMQIASASARVAAPIATPTAMPTVSQTAVLRVATLALPPRRGVSDPPATKDAMPMRRLSAGLRGVERDHCTPDPALANRERLTARAVAQKEDGSARLRATDRTVNQRPKYAILNHELSLDEYTS